MEGKPIKPSNYWTEVNLDQSSLFLIFFHSYLKAAAVLLTSVDLRLRIRGRWPLGSRLVLRQHLQCNPHSYQQQPRTMLFSQRFGENHVRKQQCHCFPCCCHLSHFTDLKCMKKHVVIKRNQDFARTIAVVAAPNRAMRERTETCPIKVAMASKTRTP